jgi:exosortase/archaeosortase family protein
MFSLSNNLVKRFPVLYNYKPGIDFLTRLFFIGVFLIAIKKLYGWSADVNGNIDVPLIGHFSAIEALRTLLLHSCKILLEALGYPAVIHGWLVGISGGFVRLETPCLGINVCFVFISLVLAFPSPIKWTYKILYVILGVLLIQFLNIWRIAGMVFVTKNKYHLPIEHHDLFNLIIYIVVFMLFYYFISLSTNPRSFLVDGNIKK